MGALSSDLKDNPRETAWRALVRRRAAAAMPGPGERVSRTDAVLLASYLTQALDKLEAAEAENKLLRAEIERFGRACIAELERERDAALAREKALREMVQTSNGLTCESRRGETP
jgi:hypothetical protein